MKLLITILCCIMISCTTTVIQPPDKPNLVGTWVSVKEMKVSIDERPYANRYTFKRYDTLVISIDTIRHIQLIRTMDSVILNNGDSSDPSYIIPAIRAPKDSVLYHDTVSCSYYETSGDGYNIHIIRTRIIKDNEYGYNMINIIDSSVDRQSFDLYYPSNVKDSLRYVFFKDYGEPIYINTKGQLTCDGYYRLIYTKIN